VIRERITAALKAAATEQDRRRACMLRLIGTAVRDRDQACRDLGKDGISDDDILNLLLTMQKQREEQARAYEESGQHALAETERREIEVLREFLPPQLDEAAVHSACAEVVRDIGAQGLRDVGRTMTALKERYPGRMDFSRASGVVKKLLG